MKRYTMLLFLLLSYGFSIGQLNLPLISDSIEREGKALYRSERASWLATDIFLNKFKEQEKNLGGYFSYADEDKTKTVFFSRGDAHQVLCTITFPTGFNSSEVDNVQREFNLVEKDIYTFRQTAVLASTTDSFFKRYKGTDLNFVPIVDGKVKKVYILTGSQNNDDVLFGNDYLLMFDSQNNMISKQRLHSSLIPVGIKMGGDSVANGSIHTHLPEFSPFITSTDVVTEMLYQQFTGWKQLIVVSENYVSIWNCTDNKLAILSRKAWEKISKHK